MNKTIYKAFIFYMRKKILFSFWMLLLVISSCKRVDEASWNTRIKTPLAEADLSLTDLIADSLLLSDDDGAYRLIYEYETLLDSFGDVLNVPDTLNQVSVSLNQLILEDRTLTDTITLREIMPESRFLDGTTVPLPAQDITSAGAQEIDISEAFFRKAKFKKGFLEIGIHNDLPVYVDLIVFKLYNKSNLAEIANDTFTDIAPFSSAYKSISLAGKEVDGILVGELIRVKTRASAGPVLIDADKGLRLELKVTGLEPEYATAVFPSQTLIQENQEVTYKFGGPEITVMRIRSGYVKMKVVSTLEEEIVLNYSIPQSSYKGQPGTPLVKEVRVPPAPRGKTSSIDQLFSIADYEVLYKGKDPNNPPFTNTVYSELSARMESSGKERYIALSDSVFIIFGLVDIVPEFAIGDFGKKTYSINEKEAIKAFKNITGTLSLESVNMSLLLENAFGIEADLQIKNLNGINNRNGKSAKLWSADLDQVITLPRAMNPPLTSTYRILTFNNQNSTLKPFIENLPDQLHSEFNIVSRPRGSNNYTDFVFFDSYLKARLRLDMPIHFGADNLRLIQKRDWDLTKNQERSDRIKSGTLTVLIENDFPLSANIQIEFLSDTEEVLTTLFPSGSAGEAAAGMITPGQEKTTAPGSSRLSVEVNEAKMALVKQAKYIRIISTLNTPGSERYKIFDHYKINVKVLADFIYEQRL